MPNRNRALWMLALVALLLPALALPDAWLPAAQAAVLQDQDTPEDEEEVEERPNGPWDTSEARGETRDIDFTTEEGTWMSVDVSPDGQWLAFDLLANVYRMPIGGGDAECLTCDSGVAVNYHPRYSPDGSEIAFVSDRDGQNNLWVMNADGSDPESVVNSKSKRHLAPAWTADGEYIIVQQSSAGRGGGPAGTFMYHRDGGNGVELLAGSASASWPEPSTDGRWLYYQARAGSSREIFAGSYQLNRLDLQTGDVLQVTAGQGGQQTRNSSGGAFAPAISPDGRWLAFGRRVEGTIEHKGHQFGPRTALWLRDLETGAEHKLMDPIEQDMTEGMKVLRVLPGYTWTPDGRSIILSQGGKFRRLWLDQWLLNGNHEFFPEPGVQADGGVVTTIPFSARVQRTISEMAYKPFRIEDDDFQAKFLRWYAPSPAGDRLAFQAIGRIWVSKLTAPEPMDDEGHTDENGEDGEEHGDDQAGEGEHADDDMDMDMGHEGEERAEPAAGSASTPTRLTPGSFQPHEFSPVWSPDGNWIAFTSWDNEGRGHLWKVSSRGGDPVQLSDEPGEFINPSWSPDGSEIVVARGSGATARGRTFAANAWFEFVRYDADGTLPFPGASIGHVAYVPAAGGRAHPVRPMWHADGRIFWVARGTNGDNGPARQQLNSVNPDGTDRQVHVSLPASDDMELSPDGRHVAFQEGDNVFVTPVPLARSAGEPVDIEKRGGRLPITTVSKRGGLYPHWLDNNTVAYGSGPAFYTYSLAAGADATHPNAATTRYAVDLQVPRALPEGSVAFTNARIVTLENRNVIETGDLVITNGRISCVGARGECNASSADRMIDATGRRSSPAWWTCTRTTTASTPA